MNRHDRRRARALGVARAHEDPELRAAYARAAEAFFEAFKGGLHAFADEEPPRFAFLPDEMACLIPLDINGFGRRLARNATARMLVDLLLMFADARGLEPPTYMMLRAFVEATGVAVEIVGPSDLGLAPVGHSPGTWGAS